MKESEKWFGFYEAICIIYLFSLVGQEYSRLYCQQPNALIVVDLGWSNSKSISWLW